MLGVIPVELAAQQQLHNVSVEGSWVHYVTPGWCTAAADRLSTEYWRDKRPDTVVYAPLTDSVPAVVRQAVRTCAAHFTVSTVPVRDLIALTRLLLWIGEDDRARAAADRLIAEQRRLSVAQRGWTLSLIVESFLAAKPLRLTDVARYLNQLDALGAPVARWRATAHARVGETMFSLGDIAAADSQSRAAMVAVGQMSKTDQMNDLDRLFDMYADAAEVTGVQSGASALQVVDSARKFLMALRPTGSAGAFLVQARLNRMHGIYKLYGMAAPQLTASHWYVPAGDTVRPKLGVTSLLVFANSECGAKCYPRYATIRRLAAKYASIEITLLTGTGGYYRSHPMPKPAVESDSVRHYFLDFLQLPVGIAATDVAFSFRADGRRMNHPTENVRNYDRGPSAIVVGPDGVIRLAVSLGPKREAIVSDMIMAVRKQ